MSTSTEVETVLDQQTIEDLRPPCEFREWTADQQKRNCEDPAKAVAYVTCPKCGEQQTLLCMDHAGYCLRKEVGCTECHSTLTVHRVVPL